jgi:zinc protease
VDARRGVGPFVASTQTKNESAAEVARILVNELARLAREPISQTELTPRKAVLTGGFARSLETTSGIVAQVANLALYGLSLGDINRFIPSVQAVGANDVRQFAGKRLPSSGTIVAIVGDAKRFLPDLRRRFPGATIETIPEARLDLNRAD